MEEIVTPSGVTIRYDDRRHFYWINGEKVDAVSKILGVLDVPALKWWGMAIGVGASVHLLSAGVIPTDRGTAIETWLRSGGTLDDAPASVNDAVTLLTANKLTVNHVSSKAGERGTTVHDALEHWAHTGSLPDPNRYAIAHQGYVRGLLAFLADAKIDPVTTETIVGSVAHRYAGRYDLRASVSECELVTSRMRDKKTKEVTETRGVVSAGICTLDLKTKSGVYADAHLQLAGYEGASVECGYAPTDYQAVLRVTTDGGYEFVRSEATYADFLVVKACHDAVAALKKRSAA